MPYEKLPIGGAHADVLSWAGHEFSIEEQAMLRNVSRLPCLFKHVALMPDAHLGKGSMVGSVVATKEAVIPATVGVDIGCGMMAVKTPFRSGILDGKLKDLRLKIEEEIPVGFNAYKESVDEASYWDGWKDFGELHQGVRDRKKKAMTQLGTLGGGNHFIEVCLDTENFVWLMLHSGSRNIGKELAERHIATAKSLVEAIGITRSRPCLLHSGHAGICGVLERPEVGASIRYEESRDHDDASVEGLQQDVQSSSTVHA